MNHSSNNADDFDAYADDLPTIGEIEYEESDGVETTVELELLLGRIHTMRFAGA